MDHVGINIIYREAIVDVRVIAKFKLDISKNGITWN